MFLKCGLSRFLALAIIIIQARCGGKVSRNISKDEQALAKADLGDNAPDGSMPVVHYIDPEEPGELKDKLKKIPCFDVDRTIYLFLIEKIYEIVIGVWIHNANIQEENKNRNRGFYKDIASDAFDMLKIEYGLSELRKDKEGSPPASEDRTPNNLDQRKRDLISGVFAYFTTVAYSQPPYEYGCGSKITSEEDKLSNTFNRVSTDFFKIFWVQYSPAISFVESIKAFMEVLNNECDEKPDNIYNCYRFMKAIDMEACTSFNIARILVFLDQIISSIETLKKAYKLEACGMIEGKTTLLTKRSVYDYDLKLERFFGTKNSTHNKLDAYMKEYLDIFDEIAPKNDDLDKLYQKYCAELSSLKKIIV